MPAKSCTWAPYGPKGAGFYTADNKYCGATQEEATKYLKSKSHHVGNPNMPPPPAGKVGHLPGKKPMAQDGNLFPPGKVMPKANSPGKSGGTVNKGGGYKAPYNQWKPGGSKTGYGAPSLPRQGNYSGGGYQAGPIYYASPVDGMSYADAQALADRQVAEAADIAESQEAAVANLAARVKAERELAERQAYDAGAQQGAEQAEQAAEESE